MILGSEIIQPEFIMLNLFPIKIFVDIELLIGYYLYISRSAYIE